MTLSLGQLDQLLATMREQMAGMAGISLVIAGPQWIEPDRVQAMVASGLLDPTLAGQIQRGEHPSLVAEGFTTGLLFHRLVEAGRDPSEWSTEQWVGELQRRPLALSAAESEAMQWAQRRAGEYCQGLANTLEQKTRQLVVESLSEDRTRVLQGSEIRRNTMLDAVQQATAESIENRKGRRWLRSRLLELTHDGARDWQRIAETESQRAHDTGVAMDISNRHGRDAKVYKRPHAKACKHCTSAYTVDGTVPRIFTLAELEANGSNQGRKAADWLATLGPMHPWCACPLRHLAPGMTFDAEGNLVRAGRA